MSMELLLITFLIVVGPLAVLFGADSRNTDTRVKLALDLDSAAKLAIDAGTQLGGDIEHRVRIVSLRPVVDDAGAQHEPPIEHRVGDVDAAIELELGHDPLVQA